MFALPLIKEGVLEARTAQTGTLSSLLTLSDACIKHDATLTNIINKIVDTLANIDPDQLECWSPSSCGCCRRIS